MEEKNGIQTIPYYLIVNKCSGMALDVMDNCARVFFPMGTALQSWCFEDLGGGNVTIMNLGTHQVLDVEMAGCENGSPVHMWNSVKATNQMWILEPAAGENVYRIRSSHSGKYLDLIDQSLEARAQLHIWDKSSSETQLWIIRPILPEASEAQAAPAAAEKPPVKRRRRTAAAEKPKPKAKRGRRSRTAQPAPETAPAELAEPAVPVPEENGNQE